jgi:hypothetical protein
MGIEGNHMNAMRFLTSASIAGIFILASAAAASAAYFPSAPSNAVLQTFTGILTDYGLGNDFGTFGLTINGSDTTFYVGLPMTMNGSRVTCHNPAASASQALCTDWPAAIILGSSIVTATCWSDASFKPGSATMFLR